MAAIAQLFATLTVFEGIFDQQSSTWVLQARDMNLTIGKLHVAPSQMQAINPLLVMLFIPLTQFCLYPWVRSLGITVTPLRCMCVGMVLASLPYVVIAIIQGVLDAGGRPSVLWQLPAYFILTLAEVLVSITGLEMAYTQAPPAMKATVMSFFMLVTFAGNLLDAFITAINVFDGIAFFIFFAALMFCAAMMFIWTASHYQVRDYGGGHGMGAEGVFKRRLSDNGGDDDLRDGSDASASHIALVNQR